MSKPKLFLAEASEECKRLYWWGELCDGCLVKEDFPGGVHKPAEGDECRSGFFASAYGKPCDVYKELLPPQNRLTLIEIPEKEVLLWLL